MVKTFSPGGDLNPNSKLNVKPGFSPGEPGGAPDKGINPAQTGATKAAARGRESGADRRMHSGDGHTTSGMDRALQQHADKMHPVKGRVMPKQASPQTQPFNDEQ